MLGLDLRGAWRALLERIPGTRLHTAKRKRRRTTELQAAGLSRKAAKAAAGREIR